ncbi:MAG: energy transducer TonB [Proteobacteria bacterium]|nr:energy transducer TonB [Pseudomonadota bacterium]
MSTWETSSASASKRVVAVVVAVIALHGVALWLLQSGLLRRAVETVIPAELIAEWVEPPRPKDEPPPPPPPPPSEVRSPVKPTVVAAPQPIAIADATPAPAAPAGVADPPAPLPPLTAAVAPTAPPAPAPTTAAPAPPRVELPSSDADYLQNPKPAYPPLSKRRNEQGRVVMRVLIGVDGLPQKAEIHQSSGYERLDAAAAETVMKWRYVPGKRAGVPEAMWFNVPISFVLQ